LSYTPDNYNCYENAGWTIKQSSSGVVNDNGEFTICMPLKYWLGFFKNFKQILLNSRLEFILTSSNKNFNYTMNKTATDGNDKAKLEIFKIIWKMPHVSVDDTERLKLILFY